MRRLLLGLVLSSLAAGCVEREWVATRPEPEAYPFESARKICDHWADQQSRGRRTAGGWPSDREGGGDLALYHRMFNYCMQHYGWELRRKGDPSQSEPTVEDESLPPLPER